MGRVPAPDRPRGEGISLVTLIIASAASAAAAFVVSRVWGTGTLIGAAATPIIVAVVTELLRRPAKRLPEIAGPPAPRPGPRGETGAGPGREPPVHVYRSGPRGREWRIVALTALAAFGIGVGAYVVLDRLAGGEGRLVPERGDRVPTPTVTTESRTVTVITQQRTVTVSTVTVPPERTVTVTTPRTGTTTAATTAPATQPTEPTVPEG